MKHAVGLVAIALVAAGCGGGSPTAGPTSVVTVTQSQVPSATTSPSPAALTVKQMRQVLPSLDDLDAGYTNDVSNDGHLLRPPCTKSAPALRDFDAASFRSFKSGGGYATDVLATAAYGYATDALAVAAFDSVKASTQACKKELVSRTHITYKEMSTGDLGDARIGVVGDAGDSGTVIYVFVRTGRVVTSTSELGSLSLSPSSVLHVAEDQANAAADLP